MARSPAPSAHSALQTSVRSHGRGRSLAFNLFLSLRPGQWTKNLVVFAGLFFAGADLSAPQHQELFDPLVVARTCAAFGIFCLLAGVVYLVNDVRDRDADATHPTKSRRPIASGAVSPSAALTTAFVLSVIALT